MKKLYFITALIFFALGCKKETGRDLSKAQYKVVFMINWNAQDFPTDYPSNAHFSPLIGWSHQTAHTFFAVDSLASQGIKEMAERGKTTPLDNELTAKIANGEGYQMYIGDGLANGVGEIKLEVEVTQDFPEVTLVSMLAPSPDWYIAALNVNLLNNGGFVKEKKVNVLVYDAGTDSGVTFTSADNITFPQDSISVIVAAPLGNGTATTPVIATAHFIKL